MPLIRPMRARARWASLRPWSTLRMPMPPRTMAAIAQGRETKKAAPVLKRSRAMERGPRKTAARAGTLLVVVGARGEPAGGGPAPRWAAAHRKPGAGLEPATPSLPWKCSTN